jgi:formylglycine-generating enzyme required for sulfatase activity
LNRDETPQHEVDLSTIRIARYPVTVVQYNAFVEAGGYDRRTFWTPVGWEWKEDKGIAGPKGFSGSLDLPNHPIVGVSWYEALAFCKWLSGIMQQDIRLPTEAEWEKAARGFDGRHYPWGNEFYADRGNVEWTDLGTTSVVGLFSHGASPYEVQDMSGNVWEWCQSLYRPYPYQASDGREDLVTEWLRVIRGGSWRDIQDYARCSSRGSRLPDTRSDEIGFRVCVAPRRT